jgi:hypothetical protein
MPTDRYSLSHFGFVVSLTVNWPGAAVRRKGLDRIVGAGGTVKNKPREFEVSSKVGNNLA